MRVAVIGGGIGGLVAGHELVAAGFDAQVIDADTSRRRRITNVPFYILSIPPFVREETGWSKVVWSPQGDRFWFSTVLDEEFNSNYYLVDLREGKRRRVLKNTSIDISAWR